MVGWEAGVWEVVGEGDLWRDFGVEVEVGDFEVRA